MSEENWQVNFAFRIKGDTIGGNGLAFWYTRDGHRTGSVYGAPDKFDGLGLAFDTFDEETKAESVPMVVGMLGNGNTTFRQGSVPNSANSFVIGSCFKSVRNTENPVFVRITYFRRHLKVEIDHAKEGSSYITCFERRGIELPIGYYMGITASTNNYPDVYEIYSLKTGIFTTVSRNADLNELKDKMTENEIFKDDSSVAQVRIIVHPLYSLHVLDFQRSQADPGEAAGDDGAHPRCPWEPGERSPPTERPHGDLGAGHPPPGQSPRPDRGVPPCHDNPPEEADQGYECEGSGWEWKLLGGE
jgi:hypothetical protein